VAHVEVNAPAIEQKSAIAGRLLVIAIVLVQHPDPAFFEEVILHAGWPRFHCATSFFRNEAAILGFDSDNSVHGLSEKPRFRVSLQFSLRKAEILNPEWEDHLMLLSALKRSGDAQRCARVRFPDMKKQPILLIICAAALLVGGCSSNVGVSAGRHSVGVGGSVR
jgi:hypothetical protein